jgi:hypothetical protein
LAILGKKPIKNENIQMYKGFKTYKKFEEAMFPCITEINKWNAQRGLLDFDAVFEAHLLAEELKEVLETTDLAHFMCELADCTFVIYGTIFKSKVSLKGEEVIESLVDLMQSVTEKYRKALGLSNVAFATLFFHALRFVIANNQLKPLDEKDKNGKVVKGNKVSDPVEMFTIACLALGYDPFKPVIHPDDMREGVLIFTSALTPEAKQ